MRIPQTVVSAVGFREVGHSKAKRDLLDGLAYCAAETSCDVLHLPAGFVLEADIGDADSFIRVAAGTPGARISVKRPGNPGASTSRATRHRRRGSGSSRP